MQWVGLRCACPDSTNHVAGGRQLRVEPIERGREQIARGNTAVRPPLLSDGHYLLLARKMVELVGTPDGPSKRKVTRQDHVFSSECEDQRTLSGPWANAWDRGQRGDELVVRQLAQDLGVQSPVGKVLG